MTKCSSESLGLKEAETSQIVEAFGSVVAEPTALRWRLFAQRHLTPGVPFELHRALHQQFSEIWPGGSGPAPLWAPTQEEVASSNLGKLSGETFETLHQRSVNEPHWWAQTLLTVLNITPDRSEDELVDLSAGPADPVWFKGMRLNIVDSCFVGRDKEANAITWAGEDGELHDISLGALESWVDVVTSSLNAFGLVPGDAIGIDMPMTWQSVAIYLGVVRAGCVAVSIADSFASPEIATRLEISKAKAIFTQDVIKRGKVIPLYE